MEAEGGEKGERQPDGTRNTLLPAAPGAHRPFNGAEPGGEGAPPSRARWFRPAEGPPPGGRGADHVLPGGGAAARSLEQPGGDGALPGTLAPLEMEPSGRVSDDFRKVVEFLLRWRGGFPSVVWPGP